MNKLSFRREGNTSFQAAFRTNGPGNTLALFPGPFSSNCAGLVG